MRQPLNASKPVTNFLSREATHRVAASRTSTNRASINGTVLASSSENGRLVEGAAPSEPFAIFTAYSASRCFTFQNTRILHNYYLKSNLLGSNVFVHNSLLDWYFKSGGAAYARNLFENVSIRNVVSWNIMISGCHMSFLYEHSWKYFCRMFGSGFHPNEVSYGSVLSACGTIGAIRWGRQVYSLALREGFIADGHVRSGMIDLLCKNGEFDDALLVFGDAHCENIVCWNSLITGSVKNGKLWHALHLFVKLCRESLVPTSFTFSSVLTACSGLEELDIGKGIQGLAVKFSAFDIFVQTAILDLYATCSSTTEAVKQFSRIPAHNVVSRTIMISSFVRNGDLVSALTVFKEMIRLKEEINCYTVTSIVAACANPEMKNEAIQIHGWILTTGFSLDSVVAASLISMYGKQGALIWSRKVFENFDNVENPHTLAAMMSSYCQTCSFQEAMDIFIKMLQKGFKPDEFAYSALMSITCCIYAGRQVHCHLLKTGAVYNVCVSNSILTMYSRCDKIDESYKVFEQMLVKDNAAWTSMITGFAEFDRVEESFGLLRNMLAEGSKPDSICLVASLTACSGAHTSHKTKEIHGYAFRSTFNQEPVVASALVTSYSKSGDLISSRKVYDLLTEKDPFSASSLISGYTQNGLYKDVIVVFCDMLKSKFTLDSYTISSVMNACVRLDMRHISVPLHALAIKKGIASSPSVGSSLVMMYSKCGSVDDCHEVFRMILQPDLIAWTIMMGNYALHGRGGEALRMYEEMKSSGIKPDSVTFVSLLNACSHSNLVEEGYFYFNSMIKDYNFEPNVQHYACMVDLLGRSGRLKEAEELINSIPIKPHPWLWNILLAACKVHGDVHLARLAADKVIELDPSDSTAYVSLSNICAESGQWQDVIEVRGLMSGSGAIKDSGWSSV